MDQNAAADREKQRTEMYDRLNHAARSFDIDQLKASTVVTNGQLAASLAIVARTSVRNAAVFQYIIDGQTEKAFETHLSLLEATVELFDKMRSLVSTSEVEA